MLSPFVAMKDGIDERSSIHDALRAFNPIGRV
jgi:hypothetical protein